ncbi:MAG: GAF domain-containing sensor histidine kinase [Actinobacteria bacterium]|nr:GAF domain-containing sensor histidine kinase [Actinomycetota bacterium]
MARTRERALVDAGMALASDLDLDRLLGRLVEIAAELTGARYAALGVIGTGPRRLERFLSYGLDDAARDAIGDLPEGRGILGALIDDARPLRLREIASDSRSVGFPANHPPMRSFLGVPILLRGVAYGNLYLTEKADGEEFSREDEEIVTLLAAQAAVAIENARLYGQATRWSSQLESMNEIAAALVEEMELQRLLELIADRARSLVQARAVAVALLQPDGTFRIEASSGADVAGLVVGRASKSAAVVARGRSERTDDVAADPEIDREIAERLGARSQVVAPLLARDRALGVVIAVDREGDDPRFDDEALRLIESFARRAAMAVNVSQRVSRDALRRAVAAQELERKRLARELHDETGQALTSILLQLSNAESAASLDDARHAIRDLRDLVVETLQDVRRLAVELRPSALDDFGLVPALRRLGQTVREASGLDVQVEARLGDARLPPEIETAVYRIVQEALTNAVKHADARHLSVVLTRKASSVAILVEDDGRGFEPSHAGGGLGLVGMRERVDLLGGSFSLESSPDAGTTIQLQLPVP